jgi:hypothetical protein
LIDGAGIREHIGDPRELQWVDLSELSKETCCSCVDGREERGVIGTPGGDAGEFVLLLAAQEQASGTRFDRAAVREALLDRLERFGAFYMHTDEQALAASGDSEERLLEPAHQGCGHLRLQMQHPDQYGVRRELVGDFLRAFHELRREGAPGLELVRLAGDHRESAVLVVRVEGDESRVPLISPSRGDHQVFVHHPDVASHLRRVQGGPDLFDDIERLAARQLEATLGHLAPGLPVFEARFAADGSCEIGQVT